MFVSLDSLLIVLLVVSSLYGFLVGKVLEVQTAFLWFVFKFLGLICAGIGIFVPLAHWLFGMAIR